MTAFSLSPNQQLRRRVVKLHINLTNRSVAEVEQIKNHFKEKRILKIVGTPNNIKLYVD